jgi:hypothetical protein
MQKDSPSKKKFVQSIAPSKMGDYPKPKLLAVLHSMTTLVVGFSA